MRNHASFLVSLFAGAIAAPVLCASEPSAAPRVLPEGQLPADVRLEPLKNLDGYFPFAVPASAEEWAARKQLLRRQMLVSQGLWPMPRATAPNVVIHGKVDRGDYTVEKVFFESYPGHFVTGSLYRPKGKNSPSPGVLCPHGHWANGRFHDAGEQATKEAIAAGAERFAEGGRSPLQARFVHLARMGCVVFHYDMIGYADSVQIAHRPGVREHMNTKDNWGFFSPQAELRLQNMMGLQTYNSIRALDWFSSLPFVDATRIAVTGASGGGTQTFMLCALDDRPALAFPAVMVSTAMQGGCTCENAPFLRFATGNVEFAAMFAPKPQGLTAADDWTKEMETKGFPELKRHYDLLGAAENVELTARLEFGHNYNAVSRAALYALVNKHFKLGLDASQLVERDYVRLSTEEMSVWDAEHPKPASGDDYERVLLKQMTDDAREQIAALVPKTADDASTLDKYREIVGGGWSVLLGRELPDFAQLEFVENIKQKHDRGEYFEIASLLRNKSAGEELPVLFLYPKDWNKQVVVWLDDRGKAGLHGSDGKPIAAVGKLLDGGYCVAGVDLLQQGEFLADGKVQDYQRLVDNGGEPWQQFAGYTYGYNLPLFSQRVGDVLTLVAFIRGHQEKTTEQVHLIGLGRSAGVIALAARAQAGEAIDRLAVDSGGFRFESLTRVDDVNFVPGAVKYGDVPALIALSAPRATLIAGEAKSLPDWVGHTFSAAKSGSGILQVVRDEGVSVSDAAVAFVIATK